MRETVLGDTPASFATSNTVDGMLRLCGDGERFPDSDMAGCKRSELRGRHDIDFVALETCAGAGCTRAPGVLGQPTRLAAGPQFCRPGP
jgi:hypothetical protein